MQAVKRKLEIVIYLSFSSKKNRVIIFFINFYKTNSLVAMDFPRQFSTASVSVGHVTSFFAASAPARFFR